MASKPMADYSQPLTARRSRSDKSEGRGRIPARNLSRRSAVREVPDRGPEFAGHRLHRGSWGLPIGLAVQKPLMTPRPSVDPTRSDRRSDQKPRPASTRKPPHKLPRHSQGRHPAHSARRAWKPERILQSPRLAGNDALMAK